MISVKKVGAEDRRLDCLSSEYFETEIRRSPILATYLGVHKYDHLLPDVSRDAFLEDVRIAEGFLEKFEGVDGGKLAFDRRIDREVAVRDLRLSVFYGRELRFWEKDPDVAGLIGGSVFPLVVRDFAPFEARLGKVVARLERAPKAIEQTRRRVRRAVKLWAGVAIEAGEQLPRFFEEITKEASRRKVPKGLSRRLGEAVAGAEERNREYVGHLKDILPSAREEFSIGRKNFEKLIELRGLGLDVDGIEELGWRYLEGSEKRLKELARRIIPGASVGKVLKRIQSERPADFRGSLVEYKRHILESKKFVLGRGIATMPKGEKLIVKETPVFERHTTPFAAYYPPAKFDRKQVGVYVVTPPKSPRGMGRHNVYAISNTSVHEGYPGHHLQLSCANTHPSLVRALAGATEFVEGWAHYCEDYVAELGYNDSPEHRFVVAGDMVWRAARIVIDVGLSSGKMSFGEAVDFLVKRVKMDREAAVAEVKRYTRSPGYNLSYLLGKHLLKELKREFKERMGDRYTDKVFHDTLLYSGSLPIKFMREICIHRAGRRRADQHPC